MSLILSALISCNTDQTKSEYYDSGELKKQYVEGQNGVVLLKEYYKSGGVKKEIFLKQNIPNGLSVTYYENGDTLAVEVYEAGEIQGLVRYYKKNGVLAEKSLLQNGSWYYSIYYEEDGTIKGELYSPLAEIPKVVSSNEGFAVNLSFPVFNGIPYFKDDLKVMWNISKKEGTSEFSFDEDLDSIVLFSSDKRNRSFSYELKDTGSYYLNYLTYFEIQDSTFNYQNIEFSVR